MKYLFSALFFTGLLLSSRIAIADYKIATVDILRIMNESSEAKEFKKTIDDKTLAARKKLEAKRTALQTQGEKLKAQNVKEDSKEAEKYRNDMKDFARMTKDMSEDIQKEVAKSNHVLQDKALALVKKYATTHEISMILEKSDAVRGSVLYSMNTTDVTDEILKEVK